MHLIRYYPYYSLFVYVFALSSLLTSSVALYTMYHIQCSGKFVQGSIFTDGLSLQFCGLNFLQMRASCPLCAVQSSIFWGLNFLLLVICENHENWTPWKFPAIQCFYRLSLVQLTKLKVGIAWADVVEGAHESFKNESYAHGIVDSKELRHSMGL